MKEEKIFEMHVQNLIRILSLKDLETEEHTHRVAAMTFHFAHLWNIPKKQLFYIRCGAQLHDIGKIGIPDAILHKSNPLTNEERAVVQMHPIYAYELLHPVSYLRRVLDIPYCHHEKWDGSGYPRGLRGTQIPFVARLFAIVDVWDALLSDRPYRTAWSKNQAIIHLRRQSGKHFDPEIVTMFGELLRRSSEFNGDNPFLSFEHASIDPQQRWDARSKLWRVIPGLN